MSITSPTPDVSCLIVNWNGREMLRNLLQSIESTRGNLNVETVVVDNASTDGAPDMVAADFPSVVLIRNPQNRSVAPAYNQAVDAAKAPMLLLLNNDVIIHPGTMQMLLDYLNQHPDAVAVGPRLMGGDGHPQRSGRNIPSFYALLNTIQFLKWTGLFRAAYRRYRRGGFDPNVSSSVGQISGAVLRVRAKAYNDCGRYDEGFEFGVEDVDLCVRLGKIGLIYYLTDAVADHLGRVSSRANRGFVYRGYECGWARFLGKHKGRATGIAYKLLVTLDMPVRIISLSGQWLLQRLTGRREKSRRTAAIVRAATEFTFTGLLRFWKS